LVGGQYRRVVAADIPADTTPEAYRLLVEGWRSMSVADKASLVDQMCRDVEVLAIAGICAANPGASEADIRYELARRRFGRQLANESFGRTRPPE
jgi:hypothetical protein